MSLPTKSDISKAIENGNSLRIKDLENFMPLSGIIGPESYSGGFCIVFPLINKNKKKALKINLMHLLILIRL